MGKETKRADPVPVNRIQGQRPTQHHGTLQRDSVHGHLVPRTTDARNDSELAFQISFSESQRDGG